MEQFWRENQPVVARHCSIIKQQTRGGEEERKKKKHIATCPEATCDAFRRDHDFLAAESRDLDTETIRTSWTYMTSHQERHYVSLTRWSPWVEFFPP